MVWSRTFLDGIVMCVIFNVTVALTWLLTPNSFSGMLPAEIRKAAPKRTKREVLVLARVLYPPVHRADRLCHSQRVSGRSVGLLEPVLDGVHRDVFRESGGFLRSGLAVPGEGEGPDHDPGHGALQGVEHQGVDADPCHPGALPGLAADYLSFSRSDLRRDRHIDSVNIMIS